MKLIGTKLEEMYPWDLIPPHGVARPHIFRRISRSMERKGWTGRSIVAVRAKGWNVSRALTGSHRIAAAGLCGITIPVYLLEFDKITNQDMVEILTWDCGYYEMKHWLAKWDKKAARIFSYDLR